MRGISSEYRVCTTKNARHGPVGENPIRVSGAGVVYANTCPSETDIHVGSLLCNIIKH